MSEWSPPASRRAVLATGAVSIASLAGCSAVANIARDGARLDRLVLRADTRETERVHLTLAHAPRDAAAYRPVWGVYKLPASGELLVLDGFVGDPGFYSLTAVAENHHTHEVHAVNTFGPSVNEEPLQFEVVIVRDGGVWINLDEAGSQISIPGYTA